MANFYLSDQSAMKSPYFFLLSVLFLIQAAGIALVQATEIDEKSLELLESVDWGFSQNQETSDDTKSEIAKPKWSKAKLGQEAMEKKEFTWELSSKKSFIKWEEINPDHFLDYANWKRERSIKDQNPGWRRNQRDFAFHEIVGRVLACSGLCRIFRGEGFANARFRSSLREGDEIETLKDSFLWVYLIDGSMVRIGPETSLTLNEVNISSKEIFFHARLNSGQVIWMGRDRQRLVAENGRETDGLFQPLPLFAVNPKETPAIRKEDLEKSLYKSLLDDSKTVKQYQRLNSWIVKNNKYRKNISSKTFLVFPNGSLSGDDLFVEVIALLGDKAYIKAIDPNHFVKNVKERETTFYYRGHENTASEKLEPGKWFEADPKGRTLSQVEDFEKLPMLGFGEFLISRIPTLLLAREYLMDMYSKPILSKRLTEDHLGRFNYRLWDRPDLKEKNEMDRRFSFLLEYTRREETTGLLTGEKFRAKMEARGDSFAAQVYDDRFYTRAMAKYLANGEQTADNSDDREVLNSTKNPFWKYVKNKK